MRSYTALTATEAIDYVQVRNCVFTATDEIAVKPLVSSRQSVDGHVNDIFLLYAANAQRSAVIKQVSPYVKPGDANEEASIFLPLARMQAEVESLQIWKLICPEYIPQVYLWDDANKIFVMEDLSRLKLLRAELLQMKRFPNFPQQIGAFLARTAFYTSDLFLSYADKKAIENHFHICCTKPIWENFLFDSIVLDNSRRTINEYVKADIDRLCADPQVRRDVAVLKEIYVTKKQCLIHSDLHASNIFVSEQEMKVFDSEFATYGPIAVDIGRLFSSLLLNYASLFGMSDIAVAVRSDYQTYLLQMIEDIYDEFSTAFLAEWQQHGAGGKTVSSHYQQHYLKTILQETLGFAACGSLCRIYEEGLSFEFTRIEDLQQRAVGQKIIIELAEYLFKQRKGIQSIREVTEVLRSYPGRMQ